MSDQASAETETAYYYPQPYWVGREGNELKTLLLFFDDLAILLPRYMAGRQQIADPTCSRDCRRFLVELGPLPPGERHKLLQVRREELQDRAYTLRRLAQRAWSLTQMATFGLGLAGAAWELCGQQDPISAAVIAAASATGLAASGGGTSTVDAYSYIHRVERTFAGPSAPTSSACSTGGDQPGSRAQSDAVGRLVSCEQRPEVRGGCCALRLVGAEQEPGGLA